MRAQIQKMALYIYLFLRLIYQNTEGVCMREREGEKRELSTTCLLRTTAEARPKQEARNSIRTPKRMVVTQVFGP